MAKIKFYRGLKEKYFAEGHEQYNSAIYFATDTQEIIVSGVSYGLDSDAKAMLAEGQIVKNVSVDGDKITISWINNTKYEDLVIDLRTAIGEASESKSGLMSADQVKALNELSEQINGGESNLSSRVEQAEADIDSLEESVQGLRSDVGDWQDTTKTITQSIGGIVTEISGINAKLEGLNGAMHFLGTREAVPTFSEDVWSDGKTYEAGDVILVGNAEYICTSENVFELFGEYGDLATNSQVQEVAGNLETLKGRVDGHDTKIAEIEGNVAQNATDIASNGTEITGVKSRLDDVEDSLEWCEAE